MSVFSSLRAARHRFYGGDVGGAVEPGRAAEIDDDLQAAAAPHGLRFGPDPSTHARCTLGGMIGNNACGSRALRYGRTSDNVIDLDLLLSDGSRIRGI